MKNILTTRSQSPDWEHNWNDALLRYQSPDWELEQKGEGINYKNYGKLN